MGAPHHINGKGIDLDLSKVKTFTKENRTNPWSLVAASNQLHRPWNRRTLYTYHDKELELPPYFIDPPETREAVSRYYAGITYMDQQVGKVLQHLRETD